MKLPEVVGTGGFLPKLEAIQRRGVNHGGSNEYFFGDSFQNDLVRSDTDFSTQLVPQVDSNADTSHFAGDGCDVIGTWKDALTQIHIKVKMRLLNDCDDSKVVMKSREERATLRISQA